MDTTVISAAMIYKLLKQLYCDAGCFPNNLTQSVFQSVPRFSHVHLIHNSLKQLLWDELVREDPI